MEILARAVGRRKEAVAQVLLVQGTGQFLINDQPADTYLQNNTFSLIKIKTPFEVAFYNSSANKEVNTNILNGEEFINEPTSGNGTAQNTVDTNKKQKIGIAPHQFDTIVKVKGGGLIGQADAIKLAIARALCYLNLNHAKEMLRISTDSSAVRATVGNSRSFDDLSSKNIEKKSEESVEGAVVSILPSDVIGYEKELRKAFKLQGLLTQDSRVKERRKYGLKKARKAPQYSKR